MKNAKVTRNALRRAVKELVNQIEFQEGTDVEVYLDSDTLMTAQVSIFDGYERVLEGAQLERQRDKDVIYDNISDWAFAKLEKEIERINMNAAYHNDMSDYRMNYETIGGRYAYQY